MLLYMQEVLREKTELQQHLSRCTPAEFDRLHNELLVAKRAVVQLPAVQHQLEQHQQLWQDAEQKLSNLQVGGRSVLHSVRWCVDAATGQAAQSKALWLGLGTSPYFGFGWARITWQECT